MQPMQNKRVNKLMKPTDWHYELSSPLKSNPNMRVMESNEIHFATTSTYSCWKPLVHVRVKLNVQSIELLRVKTIFEPQIPHTSHWRCETRHPITSLNIPLETPRRNASQSELETHQNRTSHWVFETQVYNTIHDNLWNPHITWEPHPFWIPMRTMRAQCLDETHD